MPALLLTLFLVTGACARATPQKMQEQISSWLQEGAWQEVLTAVNAAEDKSPFLLNAGGYAAYQAGDWPAAGQFYSQLLAADSNHRSALYYSAVLAMNQKAWTPAISHLQRLCLLAPAVAQYPVLLGDCYQALNKQQEAAAQYAGGLAISPGSAAIANKLARVRMTRKEYGEARSVLQSARIKNPMDAALLSTAIRLDYIQKRFGSASALTDTLISTGDLRYEALLTGLYAKMELKEYGDVLRVGELLTALGSETEEVLYYSALAQQRLGKWAAADTLLRRCLTKAIQPNIEGYYLALAEGAMQQGKMNRSFACYDTAYYLFKNPSTLYAKGLELQRSNRKSEALKVYRQYLALPAAQQNQQVSEYLKQVIADATKPK